MSTITFTPTKKPLHVDVKRMLPVSVSLSVNAVTVKTPGLAPEPAMAFIPAWHEGSRQAGVFIFLHYTNGGVVTYAPDPLPFARAELEEHVQAAREFLENMGYMLDDLDLTKETPERRQALFDALPVFHSDLKQFAEAHEADVLPDANIEPVSDDGDGPSRRALIQLLLSS